MLGFTLKHFYTFACRQIRRMRWSRNITVLAHKTIGKRPSYTANAHCSPYQVSMITSRSLDSQGWHPKPTSPLVSLQRCSQIVLLIAPPCTICNLIMFTHNIIKDIVTAFKNVKFETSIVCILDLFKIVYLCYIGRNNKL